MPEKTQPIAVTEHGDDVYRLYRTGPKEFLLNRNLEFLAKVWIDDMDQVVYDKSGGYNGEVNVWLTKMVSQTIIPPIIA